MSTARTLLPALGAGFAFTFGGSGDTPRFSPAADTTLTKTFAISGEYSLDEMSIIVDGNDVGGMLPSMDMSIKQETNLEVTDVYKSVADGRPKELLRTFDALSGNFEMNLQMQVDGDMPSFESSSELEGRTVSFAWNGEKYAISFEGGDGPEDLLEGLEEDMDLRVFLPPSEVAEGDSWSVPLERLRSVVSPGGDLQLRPEGVEVDRESTKMFEDMFKEFGKDMGSAFDGECKCTFLGVRDGDGARMAEVEIDVEVATTLDLSELLGKAIRAGMEQAGAPPELDFTLDTADFSLDFDGKGTLLWDLDHGHLHSFSLTGDATIGVDITVGMEAEGEHHGIDASVELSGSFSEEVESTSR